MHQWSKEEKVDFANRFRSLWKSASADSIALCLEKLQQHFSFGDAMAGLSKIYQSQGNRMQPLVKDVVEKCRNLTLARERQSYQEEEPARPIIKWTDYERQARDTFPPWLKKILERKET